MEYYDQLLSKNGAAAISLAKVFFQYEVGDRLPTVSQLADLLSLSRGTVQNALHTLEEAKAVDLESHGHMGSYLSYKDIRVLLQIAGVTSIVGTMPLPYSRKYEGMATGLVSSMENKYNIPVTLSYTRGARNRIRMVLENRYDFAIVSLYAAQEYQKRAKELKILKDFGRGTYCSSHVIIFHDPEAREIQEGMKIGIDKSSIDQENMTRLACRGKRVVFVPVEYHSLLSRIMEGELDATVWNKDEISDHMTKINYKEISELGSHDTEAVLVANSQRPEMLSLLDELVDIPAVLHSQKLVEDGKLTPRY